MRCKMALLFFLQALSPKDKKDSFMETIYLTAVDQTSPITLVPGTLLRIEHTGSGHTVSTLAVGGRSPEFLAVLPPAVQDGQGVPDIRPDDTLHISYMLQGSMIRFSTTVKEKVTSPIDILLLAFPADAARFELRSHKRINCFLASTIEIHNSTSNLTCKGTIHDISKSGCRCNFTDVDHHRDLFTVHEQITLHCKFPGIADEQEITGIVRDIRVDEKMVSIGIEFTGVAWWVPPYDSEER